MLVEVLLVLLDELFDLVGQSLAGRQMLFGFLCILNQLPLLIDQVRFPLGIVFRGRRYRCDWSRIGWAIRRQFWALGNRRFLGGLDRLVINRSRSSGRWISLFIKLRNRLGFFLRFFSRRDIGFGGEQTEKSATAAFSWRRGGSG